MMRQGEDVHPLSEDVRVSNGVVYGADVFGAGNVIQLSTYTCCIYYSQVVDSLTLQTTDYGLQSSFEQGLARLDVRLLVRIFAEQCQIKK